MIAKLTVISVTLLFAFLILFTSVLRSASIRYNFHMPTNGIVLAKTTGVIDYELIYPGKISPDHPLWPIKVLRDKIWLLLTTDPGKKVDLRILMADKRLGLSEILFKKDKPELALRTLQKAESYLLEAQILESTNGKNGANTLESLSKLAKSSLKHRQTIDEIFDIAPDDAKSEVLNAQKISITVFEKVKNELNILGVKPPENPFESEN